MKINNKVISLIFAISFLASFLFSSEYLIENAHHDCSGADCPICMQLEVSEQLISSIRIRSFMPVVLAVFCIFIQICVQEKENPCVENTLVTMKVELLN